MKFLIIVEGLHDEKFIRHLIQNDSALSVDKATTYKAPEGKPKDIELDESDAIRMFCEPSSTCDVLIKVEGGKERLLKLLSHIAFQVFASCPGVELLVMLDADTKGVEETWKELPGRLDKRGGQRVEFKKVCEKAPKKGIFIRRYEAMIRKGESRRRLGQLLVFVLDPSLEQLAGGVGDNLEEGIKALSNGLALSAIC